jgi:hypothetical protein
MSFAALPSMFHCFPFFLFRLKRENNEEEFWQQKQIPLIDIDAPRSLTT